MTSPFSSQPHTQIHVRNLQTTLPISTDAWGRPSKSQPVLISISLSLSQPFSSAASNDVIEGSTVHYGILSKSVLAHCGAVRSDPSGEWLKENQGTTIWGFLIGLDKHLFSDVVEGDQPFLRENMLEGWRSEVFLIKGSLLGCGVRMTKFVDCKVESDREGERFVLCLEKLSVPCLIGVNDIERKAKQLVIATVGIESGRKGMVLVGEEFVKLEGVVVKAISESEFKTLESLTSYLTNNIIREFLSKFDFAKKAANDYPKLRMILEKPTAVTFADAPAVEVLVDTNPVRSKEVANAWKEA